MKLITNILIEYLKYNKRIVVPKLGTFIAKQPSGHIIFSDLMRGDDGVLRSLLMAYGMRDLEANGKIDRLVFDIHHAISRGESYTLKGFGTFSQGENNTTIFNQKREPQIIGGNIKPPVETLNIEKLKLQRYSDLYRTAANRQTHNISKQTAKRVEEVDGRNLSMRDDYLRGLKYDKNKKSRRNEERTDSGSKRLSPAVVIILILLIVAGIVWYGWTWLNGNSVGMELFNVEHTTAEGMEMMITADTLTGADTTLIAPAMDDIDKSITNVNQ